MFPKLCHILTTSPNAQFFAGVIEHIQGLRLFNHPTTSSNFPQKSWFSIYMIVFLHSLNSYLRASWGNKTWKHLSPKERYPKFSVRRLVFRLKILWLSVRTVAAFYSSPQSHQTSGVSCALWTRSYFSSSPASIIRRSSTATDGRTSPTDGKYCRTNSYWTRSWLGKSRVPEKRHKARRYSSSELQLQGRHRGDVLYWDCR